MLLYVAAGFPIGHSRERGNLDVVAKRETADERHSRERGNPVLNDVGLPYL